MDHKPHEWIQGPSSLHPVRSTSSTAPPESLTRPIGKSDFDTKEKLELVSATHAQSLEFDKTFRTRTGSDRSCEGKLLELEYDKLRCKAVNSA